MTGATPILISVAGCPLHWRSDRALDGSWLISDGETLVAAGFPTETAAENWIAHSLMGWARCHPEHVQ